MTENNKSGQKEGYLVIARKYRPQTFDDVIGQEHIVRTLKNAIAQNRVHHFYLFTGSRGIGKTSTARVLAKALNCKEGPTAEPCGKCPVCLQISEGKGSEILALYEIDGASNRGVEDVRELRKTIRQKVGVRYRVIIIDEVHMLTPEAFNALLKTLEEPPEHVKFIFATTEVHKVPETIISRCQRLDFRRISETEIADQLMKICKKENIDAEYSALKLLAKIAEGGMRDSQSKLDQAVAFTDGTITVSAIENIFGIISRGNLLKLVEAFRNSNFVEVLNFAENAYSEGVDIAQLIKDLINIFREIMLVQTAGADTKLLDIQDDERENLDAIAKKFTLDNIMYATEILTGALKRLKMTEFPRLTIEIAFVKLCKIGELVQLENILSYLEAGAIKAGQRIQIDKPIQAEIQSSSQPKISIASETTKPASTEKATKPAKIVTNEKVTESAKSEEKPANKSEAKLGKKPVAENSSDVILSEEKADTPVTDVSPSVILSEAKNPAENPEKSEAKPKKPRKKAAKKKTDAKADEKSAKEVKTDEKIPEKSEDNPNKDEKKSGKKKTRDQAFSDVNNTKTESFNRAAAFIKSLKSFASKMKKWENSATVIPWLEHNLISIEEDNNQAIITLGSDTFEKELNDPQGNEIITKAVAKIFDSAKIAGFQIKTNSEFGLREKLRNHELVKELQRKFSAQILTIKEKKLWQSETLEAEADSVE